jgi:hypothetical protein
VSSEHAVVIEFFGEGKTDVGTGTQATPPTTGVVPILVHQLCGRPTTMLTKRRSFAFLQGKNLAQKVRFAKRQAFYNGSAGAVFVMDSEGDDRKRQKVLDDLSRGREQEQVSLPLAVGVAQPCIEPWLLADQQAVRRVTGLQDPLELPAEPESLPAPCQGETGNPKAILAGWGVRSAAQKDAIARAIDSTKPLEERCPRGFGNFAQEVRQEIKALFSD